MSALSCRVVGLTLTLVAVAACGRREQNESARADSTVPSAAAPAEPAAAAPAAPAPAPQESTPTARPRADTARSRPRAPAESTARQPSRKPAEQSAQKPARQPARQPAQQPPAAQAPAEQPLRDPYHQAPRDTVTQAVYDGWKQFNLNCARCHGEDVQGTTIAPHLINSLKPEGPINTKELFQQTVCAGRPAKGMPAWCSLGLSIDKIDEIYSYVKARSDGKVGPGRPAVRPG